MKIRTCLALACLAGAALPASAQIITSGTERNALLELYTSEGCSSCPPADAWLAGLIDSDALWSQVVPVAFHVTYWDDLGWPDDLARRSHDARQYRLARSNRSGVYTPGVFLDGAEHRRWRRSPAASAPSLPDRVGDLELQLAEGTLRAHFAPLQSEPSGTAPLSLRVAWLRGASSEVRRGENRGRRLRHEFAVARLDTIELEFDGDRYAVDAALSRPTVTDSPAIAAWVEDRNGRVLQAAGAWLTPAPGS